MFAFSPTMESYYFLTIKNILFINYNGIVCGKSTLTGLLFKSFDMKKHGNYTEVAYSSVTNPRVNAVTCLPRLWMISVFSSFSCISLC